MMQKSQKSNFIGLNWFNPYQRFWKCSRREGRGSSFMAREKALWSSGLEQRSMTSFCDASTFGSTGVHCRCLITEGEVSDSDEITITDCRWRRWRRLRDWVGELDSKWSFLRFWAGWVGEIEKGDSSLVGADTSVEVKLPIKGSEIVANTVGVARSSWICVVLGNDEAGAGLASVVNQFRSWCCRTVSWEINVYIGWRFCKKNGFRLLL